MAVFCEYLWEKRLCYKGTALHLASAVDADGLMHQGINTHSAADKAMHFHRIMRLLMHVCVSKLGQQWFRE